MYKYFFSLLLLLFAGKAEAQADSGSIKPNLHQLRLGVDVSRPIMSLWIHNRQELSTSLDYYLGRELYGVVEGGFGGSQMDYPDLKYQSSNSFFRLGIEKSMLARMFPGDWDMLSVGVRYGVAFIKRDDAIYAVTDPIWGTATGRVQGKNLSAHWAELTAGLRVELLQGLFAGYTVRGKFLVNQSTFHELPPAYIAGYGQGEKNTVFDFNFYVLYAIRWK